MLCLFLSLRVSALDTSRKYMFVLFSGRSAWWLLYALSCAFSQASWVMCQSMLNCDSAYFFKCRLLLGVISSRIARLGVARFSALVTGVTVRGAGAFGVA